MATNPDAATKADDNNTNDETNNNNKNDNNENTTNENDNNKGNNDSKPNKEDDNDDNNNKAESDKNIHVPKDKKLKIESVKVKEAISDNDIIFYDIYVKTAQNHWIVRKRYSEFEDLHNMLIKFTKSSSLPVLPPKHYKFFTDHADPKFIEQRRALLDNYVRRLIKLKDISSMQPVVNFFHDSKAIQINGIIHKNENEDDTANNNTDNNNDNNNNNNNNNNPNNNEEKLDDKTNNNNNNNTNDTNNNNSNNNDNTATDKIDKLVEESLSPNAKIVVKCEENYSFPSDQEITGIEIQSLRKMSDHVLYQILVKNEHREEPYDKWTVMKRFHNIYMLDQELRKDFQNEERNDLLKEMPLMPERKSKLVHDHMDDAFMEARQVLLQNYFNKMLRIEDIAKNKKFLSFFGVEVD